MAPSPAQMYAHVLQHDLCAFIHRSFLELNPQSSFHSNWHIELIASKLEDVRRGRCRRLIVNVPPRHLKSHDPSKQILSVTYAQDLSETLARGSRSLMTSAFFKALFDTRLSRETISEFVTTEGGYRFSTSVNGVLTGRGADIIITSSSMIHSRPMMPFRIRDVVRSTSGLPILCSAASTIGKRVQSLL